MSGDAPRGATSVAEVGSCAARCTSLLGAGACCDGPYHVYEQRQARGGVLTYFCSNRERPAAALVTPEGSAYRALTKVATQM